MMHDLIARLARSFPSSPQAVPLEITLLLLTIGLLIFMWDFFDRRSKSLRKKSGLSEHSETISLKNSTVLPSKDYVSQRLGLASRPDALIKEEGYIIPVDIKFSSKRVRDRHVIQLLCHMRLIEELEGKRPPYGLLLMGEEGRRVRIQNSQDKQRWLETIVEEMRSIAQGIPAVPAPAKYKCRNCDVREACAHSACKEN